MQRSSYRQKIVLRCQKDTKNQRGNPLRGNTWSKSKIKTE